MYLDESGGNPYSNISAFNPDNVPVTQCGSMIINDTDGRMAIFDTTGKMIGNTTGNYNMRSLPSGIYLVRVSGIKGACKIIKN